MRTKSHSKPFISFPSLSFGVCCSFRVVPFACLMASVRAASYLFARRLATSWTGLSKIRLSLSRPFGTPPKRDASEKVLDVLSREFDRCEPVETAVWVERGHRARNLLVERLHPALHPLWLANVVRSPDVRVVFRALEDHILRTFNDAVPHGVIAGLKHHIADLGLVREV